jgi:hypothetical protein
MIASQPTSAAEHCRLEPTAHHLSQIEFAVLRLAQAATGDGTGQ